MRSSGPVVKVAEIFVKSSKSSGYHVSHHSIQASIAIIDKNELLKNQT